MRRRAFLLQTSAVALAGLATRHLPTWAALPAPPTSYRAGLELFTVMRELDQDLRGTLKRVAALGYQEVETSFSSKPGFYGLKAREFAALTRELGLAWVSHAAPRGPLRLPPGTSLPPGPDGKPLVLPPLLNLEENLPEILDNLAAASVPYLVCTTLPPSSLNDVKASIELLNRAQPLTQAAGCTLCYHNHDTEFKLMQGQVPYELLLSQTTVPMELDLAWATKGGRDLPALFAQHPGRFPLWHAKDLSRDHQTLLPVGQGIVDFKGLLAHAQLAGLRHLFVEHDQPADPFASIASSRQALRKLLP